MTKAKRQGGCKRCNKPNVYVLISSILSGGILYTTASAANTVTTKIHPRTEETSALSGLDSRAKATLSYPEQIATSPKPEMAATSPESLTTEALITNVTKLRQAIPVSEASPLVKPEVIAASPNSLNTKASITDVKQMPANIPNLARVVTTATALKQSGESGPTIEQTTPQPPQTTPQPQQMMLSDVQGNWAQSLIVALADQGIIRGYPDSTFQPNAPMTRAEFAAIITKAFPKAPVRGTANFVDVPANYWDYGAIQTAYSTGFLSGTPDGRFNPEDNITRVDVLVALANGLNLPPSNQPITFQDATQIPDYARSSIATAVANHLVVNYPDVNFLNPNKIATRADVAAFIYQALVNSGAVKPLAASDTTNQYIVGYQPPSLTPSPAPTTSPEETAQPPTPQEIQQLQSRLQRLESFSFRQIYTITPSLTGGIPSGFGLNWGQAFLGFGGVFRTRYTNKVDGAIIAGFGLGSARTALGLEVVPTITSLAGGSGNGIFGSGGASFKLHRLLGPDLSVAAGIENLFQYGPRDTQTSGYGVISKIFRLQPSTASLFSRLYTSVGIGGGRFRSEQDIIARKGSVNVFGGVGLLVVEPLSVYGEWTGQDLNLGASVVPFRNLPLVVTGFLQDVTGNAGDGVRLGGAVGYAISF